MKTTVFFAACVLMATATFAQNQKIDQIEVTAPKFQCELYNSVNEFLSANVEYPQKSKNAGFQGTEIIEFTVTTDGTIENFRVINSVSSDCDREVLHVLETTNGKWNAGKINGIPADMQNEISVVFFLHTAEDMIKAAKYYQEKGNCCLMEKNNPKKALKYFNRGIVLLPNEESLLALRGLCHWYLGNETQAFTDWERIKYLSQKKGSANVLKNLAHIDQNTAGYAELVETLKK